jgi:hypothetical protein
MKVGYSRLLLNDWVLPEQNAPLFSSLLDINMLGLFASMERTTTQFREILESEGFEFVQLHGLAGAEAVIEAIPKADPVPVSLAPKMEEDVPEPIAQEQQAVVETEPATEPIIEEKLKAIVIEEEMPQISDAAIIKAKPVSEDSSISQAPIEISEKLVAEGSRRSSDDSVETRSNSSGEVEIEEIPVVEEQPQQVHVLVQSLPRQEKHNVTVEVTAVEDEPLPVAAV